MDEIKSYHECFNNVPVYFLMVKYHSGLFIEKLVDQF